MICYLFLFLFFLFFVIVLFCRAELVVELDEQTKTPALVLSADRLEASNPNWTFESVHSTLCVGRGMSTVPPYPAGWYYEVTLKCTGILQIGTYFRIVLPRLSNILFLFYFCFVFVLFCFVLFCFVLFLFCFVFVLFCFCFVLFCFVLFLFCFVLFCFCLHYRSGFCFVFVLFFCFLFCFLQWRNLYLLNLIDDLFSKAGKPKNADTVPSEALGLVTTRTRVLSMVRGVKYGVDPLVNN